MSTLLLPALLALSGSAGAALDCAHSSPRSLDLDLSGVTRVVVDIGNSTLRLRAGKAASASGRACSSHADQLDKIQLVQSRSGDTLTIKAESKAEWTGIFFSSTYGYIDFDVTLPSSLPLDLYVGSGDADVIGIDTVSLDVGSGDAKLRDAQRLALEVGSGDAEIENVSGELSVEVGSGDAKVRGVGAVTDAEVGSGDIEIEQVRGDVSISRIGSGDIDLRNVEGSVTAGKIGSGDLVARGVKGDLTVRRIGSGDVSHSDVGGKVDMPEDD